MRIAIKSEMGMVNIRKVGIREKNQLGDICKTDPFIDKSDRSTEGFFSRRRTKVNTKRIMKKGRAISFRMYRCIKNA